MSAEPGGHTAYLCNFDSDISFARLCLFMFCLFVCLFCVSTVLLVYRRVHCVNLAIWLLYDNKLIYLNLLTYPRDRGGDARKFIHSFIHSFSGSRRLWTDGWTRDVRSWSVATCVRPAASLRALSSVDADNVICL